MKYVKCYSLVVPQNKFYQGTNNCLAFFFIDPNKRSATKAISCSYYNNYIFLFGFYYNKIFLSAHYRKLILS